MRLSVTKKIWTGFSILLAIMLIMGGSSYFATKKLNDEYAMLLDDRAHKVNLSDELISAQKERYIAISSYVLFKTQEFVAQRDESSAQATELIDRLDDSFTSSANKEIVDEISVLHVEFSELVDELSYSLMRANDTQNRNLLREANLVNLQIMEKATELKDRQYKEMKQSRDEIADLTNFIHILTLLFIATAIIISLIVAAKISRSIGAPVRTITQAMERIADGDLTVEHVTIKNKDEIGLMANAFNQMSDDLRSLLEQIRFSSHQLAAQAEQLSASSEESLASSEMVASSSQKNMQDSEDQSELVEETVTSVSRLTLDVNQIAASNTNMLEAMRTVIAHVSTGSSTVEELSGQMTHTDTIIQEAAVIIQSMAKQSNEIQQVTSLITAISEQTNLLALNAAIEAARAGEHGKGFAVVAEEVRNLAEQSKSSAAEIGHMIHSIQEATKLAVQAIDSGSVSMKDGLTATAESKQTFIEIEHSVQAVNDNVVTVTEAIEQIRTMTETISQSAVQVRKLAESTAFTAQETSAATEEQLAVNEEISTSSQTLAGLAENLQKEVNRFTF
ncbi:methyl-accepting chemotaxis protein [Sporosarcina oncorhynchi]|uniref:Methyl-accepting chemotaxis protein n=1 Tax=Sporosarcina oncorhynchi TaxID=3056444 RepID=A0ABZ0LAM9_9BACL|nr:methyl-accepting chemotaxis protein [Sporosarcina sp. T2O-4]WOV88631.1 methyl-accepting chemotaxis protein [Sporosarcina sp. T2O-4]